MTAPSRLGDALKLAAAGLPTFPCGPDKKPRVKWRESATSDPEVLRLWWATWPDSLPAVPMGEPSDLWMLDLDVSSDGEPLGERSAAGLGIVPAQHPYAIRTRRGGWHLPYRWHADLPRNTSGRVPGIDSRGEGGYVIAWDAERLAAAAADPDLNEPPETVVTRLRTPEPPPKANGHDASTIPDAYVRAAVDAECRGVAAAPEGQRNDTLNRAAFALGTLVGAHALSRREAEARLMGAAYACGLPHPEALASIRSGLDAGQQHPRRIEPQHRQHRQQAEQHDKPREEQTDQQREEQAEQPRDDQAERGHAKREGKPPPPRWPEPLDVFGDDDLLGAPPLRPDHLPDAIAPFAFDLAARVGVDPAGAALACLTAVAAAIPETWELQPKRHDTGWTERARVWGGIVGDPSSKKTPVIAGATKPIDGIEAEARERHAKELEAWGAKVAALKREKVPAEEWPPKPLCTRYLVESTTVEALSEVLRSGDGARFHAPLGRVLVRQDELGEWLANLDRYNAGGRGGGDRGAYLRLYNGGRFTIDRIQRGSFTCPSWSACLLGGIQPEPLRRLGAEGADDGLLQRFTLIVPGACDAGEDRAPDRDAAERYRAVIRAAVTLHPPTVPGERTRPVVLHEDAHPHRERIDRLAAAIGAMPDASPRRRSALAKWPGLFARLLLTFHVAEQADHAARGLQPPSPLVASAENARRVAALMQDVLLPHLFRAERVLGDTPGQGHATWIANFIITSPEVREAERITARDIVRAYGALRPPERRAALLETMAGIEAFGWVAAEPPRNGAAEPHAWRVNPRVFERFAERAAAERERRDRVAAAIREFVGPSGSRGRE